MSAELKQKARKPKRTPTRMDNYDTRVWICEGHRPAHDSAPYAQGVTLSEAEGRTLRNLIGSYYIKCRLRRVAEGNRLKYIKQGF